MLNKKLININYIEGYGLKLAKSSFLAGTNELIELTFQHNKKEYKGIFNQCHQAVIPISDIPITEYFYTEDKKNYCFIRYDFTTNFYESYHVQKDDKGDYRIANYFKGNKLENYRLFNIKEEPCWFVEKSNNGHTEIALYEPVEAKIITPFFTYINFDIEKKESLILFKKEIYSMQYNTNLADIYGYIDYNGNFASPLYLPDEDEYYDASNYNIDKSFVSFNNFVDTKRLEKEKLKSQEESQKITGLNKLLDNLYSSSEKIPGAIKKAKIIQFRGGQNEKK